MKIDARQMAMVNCATVRHLYYCIIDYDRLRSRVCISPSEETDAKTSKSNPRFFGHKIMT